MSKSFIAAGELSVCDDGSVLSTVLGSCVSVCVFDTVKKIGGMNHYLLPVKIEETSTYENPLMYGQYSILELFRQMKSKGCRQEDIVVKILGGANEEQNSQSQIHIENVLVAKKIIGELGFRIQGQSTGGTEGRRVEFSTATGEVKFSLIKKKPPTQEQRIRVMIVDDSGPARRVIREMLLSDSGIEVVSEVSSALEAKKVFNDVKPDIMTLDLHMPGMDGLTYLKQLMSTNPIPVIIVTSYSLSEGGVILEALEAGAFDYVHKPSFEEIEEIKPQLCKRIHSAFDDQSSGRFLTRSIARKVSNTKSQVSSSFKEDAILKSIIVIGASTGGTEAIRAVLERLPSKIPPILIAQHMPSGFTHSFAERLNQLCPFSVTEAVDGEELVPNHAYIAPGGKHLEIKTRVGKYYARLTSEPENTIFKPSVDVLFHSASNINKKVVVAALLTGMGDDGANGLLILRRKGCQTIIQNEATCVVYGMPKAAYERGAAQHVLPIFEIGPHLVKLLNSVKY